MKKIIGIVIIVSCCVLSASAQSVTGLKSIVSNTDTLRNRLPIEKLYLQTDKPYYILGDTLRFKSYLLNADYLTPSKRSRLMYVELDNSNNQSVKRLMVPVTSGISWGNMVLDEAEVPEGSYTLRAYTNWMRNFGECYIFKKRIYITASNSSSTLVKADFKLDSIAGKNKVQASLRFTNLEKEPLRLKNMQMEVVNGRHTLFKDKINTGMGGSIDLNFDLTDKAAIKDLAIQAQQTGKGADTATLTIPIILNSPENTDVQFMPEGGSLVAGIPAKVGFKAIGEDGNGTDINGKIIDSEQKEITRFQSVHKGMGSFELAPAANESYTAIVNLPGNTTKSYSLPKVNPAGTALSIVPKGDDSLEVMLSLKSEVLSQKSVSAPGFGLKTQDLNTCYLIAQARGIVCFAASVSFKQPVIKKTLPKDLFPTGIVRFTLLNQNNQPLNERIFYIDHNDNLRVSITPARQKYGIRDSVALAVRVADKAGNPVQGDFSLAVTDDSQVKPDSAASNILNNLLFTSDLKGTVEGPGWYFDPDSYREDNNKAIQHPDSYRENNKAIALDNLLLTQGWVGYNWLEIFNPPATKPQYAAEKQFTIQGKLTNIFNKPVKKADVSLLQKRPVLTMDTSSDDQGRFVFKDRRLFLSDSAYYLLQVRNKRGESKNVGIDVDDFIPPVFAPLKEQIPPWYVNSDTVLLNNNSTKAAQLKAAANYTGEGHLLKEVTVKDKKLIPGSQNPYPSVQVSIVLDEKDMNAAKKMSLYELLQHRYNKGFRKEMDYGSLWYILNSRLVILYIDGEWVSLTTTDLYMDYLTAEDIRGIEVVYKITSGRYDLALTYITTYSGKGPLIKHTPGNYVYKPISPGPAKEFYRPRYTPKNNNIAIGTDLRSIIHWQPNVITDQDGKATVSFFSADKPADYTIIMEGTDLNGNLGYLRKKLIITQSAK